MTGDSQLDGRARRNLWVRDEVAVVLAIAGRAAAGVLNQFDRPSHGRVALLHSIIDRSDNRMVGMCHGRASCLIRRP